MGYCSCGNWVDEGSVCSHCGGGGGSTYYDYEEYREDIRNFERNLELNGFYDDEDHIQTSKNVVTINVDVAELLGATTNIHFDMNNSHVCAAVAARADIHIGDTLKLAIDMEKCHFFDPETQLCVTVPFYVRPVKSEE